MKEHVLRSVWHKAGFHNIISSGVPIIEDLSQMLQAPRVLSSYKDIEVSSENYLEHFFLFFYLTLIWNIIFTLQYSGNAGILQELTDAQGSKGSVWKTQLESCGGTHL